MLKLICQNYATSAKQKGTFVPQSIPWQKINRALWACYFWKVFRLYSRSFKMPLGLSLDS